GARAAPTPRYSRPPGPGTIESSVNRPTGTYGMTTRLCRNSRPLKSLYAVTRPVLGLTIEETYSSPPDHVAPSGACSPLTTCTASAPGRGTYQTPSESRRSTA